MLPAIVSDEPISGEAPNPAESPASGETEQKDNPSKASSDNSTVASIATNPDVEQLFDVTQENNLPSPVFTIPSPLWVWIRSKGISLLQAILDIKDWLLKKNNSITEKNSNNETHEPIV